MKATGIVRKIDELGRICLPIEIRRTNRISEGDELEIFTNNEFILLKKYQPEKVCVICGSTDNTREIKNGKSICTDCENDLRK